MRGCGPASPASIPIPASCPTSTRTLFGEGSFIGKGIYDVDAFDRAVGGRFPENRILSHDLLEGCYARAGLLTDVQVYEEYPSRYEEDVRRRYRWIRGDWQLWRWLLPGVPGRDGRRSRNPLPALGRWKLFDNLRRSLAPAALVGLLLVAWAVLSPAWGWTLAGVGCLLLPALVASLPGLVRKPADVLLAQHLDGQRALGRASGRAGAADTRLPPVRSVLQPRRRPPHHGADCSSRADASSSGRRPANSATPRPPGPRRRVGEDVDRPRARWRRVRVPVAGPAGRPRRRRAHPAPLVRRPGHHLADQPSADAARRAADHGPAALPPRRRPQDLGLLRHLRRPRRSLAAAGQLPGVARSRGGASHVADQHGAGAARQPLGLRLRLHLGRPARGPHDARVPGDGGDGAAPRPLLQLVRHPVARAARAAVHLLGGQRQPGRPSPDAPAGAARARRRSDPAGTRLPGPARHVRPRGRHAVGARRRPP